MDRNSQQGNAILMIFIAIGLLAALTYAFMQSNRGGQNIISDSQADAYATEILAYGNQVKQVIKRLKLRGCDDTLISFENELSIIDYTNVNNSPDRCKVFHSDGGGLQWQFPNESMLNPAQSAQTDYGRYLFTIMRIDGVGDNTTTNDLVFMVPHVSLNVCLKLNEKLNDILDPLPIDNAFQFLNFTGNYAFAGQLMTCSTCQDPRAFCMQETASALGSVNPNYLFLYTLIEN